MNKLMISSLIGVGACVGMYKAFEFQASKFIKGSPFWKEALEEVTHHKGALEYLGEPLETGMAKFIGKGMTFAGATNVRVSVAGPKSKGVVFFSVIKDEEKLIVNSIQLQIGVDDTQRLLIRGSPDDKIGS